MPRKKKEDELEGTPAEETVESTEGTVETAEETVAADAPAETTADEEPGVIDTVIDTAASVVETVADAVVSTVSSLVGGGSTEKAKTGGNRAQRIGVVTSDKMTKTVVVRVDRLIKHPKYRRYVRRKKQFMAHDEHGASIGDKVRIVETRPMSARKRWRVAEIIQKAAK